METNVIYNKSSLKMEEVDDNSIDLIVTSPPYWGLRDYGKGANQIWGGVLECKHQWDKKLPGHHPGQVPQTKKQVASGSVDSGQFCQLCGAWYGQLGLEPTLKMYIDHLLQITAECWRVLKPTGVMWWNHGDCYSAKRWSDTPSTTGISRKCSDIVVEKIHGLPDKCMVLQNFRLIIRLIDEQGWVLRNVVQWNKPNSMPSSVKDRLANKYEPVFYLVKNTKTQYYWNEKTGLMVDRKPKELKEGIDWRWVEIGEEYSDSNTKITKEEAQKLNSPRARVYRGKERKKKSYWHSLDYWFDLDAIREKYKRLEPAGGGKKVKALKEQVGIAHGGHTGLSEYKYLNDSAGKNPGDVWTIPTQAYPEAHFSTFPEKLILKPILSSCPEWICKKCGKARVRISKKIFEAAHSRGKNYKQIKGTNSFTSGKAWKDNGWNELPALKIKSINTIGWTDCGCNAGWRAGITLDLFAGSGTTLAMAKRYHRQFIGYEIVKSYIPLIRKRLAKEDTMFNRDLKEKFV